MDAVSPLLLRLVRLLERRARHDHTHARCVDITVRYKNTGMSRCVCVCVCVCVFACFVCVCVRGSDFGAVLRRSSWHTHVALFWFVDAIA